MCDPHMYLRKVCFACLIWNMLDMNRVFLLQNKNLILKKNDTGFKNSSISFQCGKHSRDFEPQNWAYQKTRIMKDFLKTKK